MTPARRRSSLGFLPALLLASIAFRPVPASAHTHWANGVPVPEWVRNACCGPADLHHLASEEVQVTPDGYRVAGVHSLVPFAKTLTSQDGEYWIFYRDFPDGTQFVFCFFAPPSGT